MVTPVGFSKFMELARRFDGAEADLANLLEISRSTLWRIKTKKIQKLSGYIDKMENHLGASPISLDEVVDDLRDWSVASEDLRNTLFSLHRMLQK